MYQSQIFTKNHWKKIAKGRLEFAIKYRKEGRAIIQENMATGYFKRLNQINAEGLYRAECARLLDRAIDATRIALNARPICHASTNEGTGNIYAK